MSNRDEYWDIDKLVPKRRSTLRPFATEVKVSEHTAEPPLYTEDDRDSSERRLSFGESIANKTLDETYIPEGGGLIKRVTISRAIDKYDFYESFRRSALLYYDCIGNKCDYAEFYSYMPQYAHMTKAQQSYYLYWRSELRRGRFIRSDYSYIYLYVYEILNLPDKIPAEEGVRLMCRVWREYRDKLPRLDANMSVWLQDYCLVHKLPCPISEVRDFISACLKGGVIKEFYLSDVSNLTLENTELLIAYLSDYDWRGGRVMESVSTNKLGVITSHEDYRRELLSAMRRVLLDLWNTRILPDGERHSTVTRDAFPHSLCTHSVKSRLTVEYISFSGSEDIRKEVTSAVRYTENKLRRLLGVKSRLAVKDGSDRAKRLIDEYFDAFFREEQKRRILESRPSYERLYDAEITSLSLEGADEIERASRLTTERLLVDEESIAPKEQLTRDSSLVIQEDDSYAIELYTDSYIPEARTDTPTAPEMSITDSPQDAPLGEKELELLSYLAGVLGDYKIPPSALLDMYAERINEVFLDEIGDVVLTQDESPCGYSIIDDYIEEVNEWLKQRA